MIGLLELSKKAKERWRELAGLRREKGTLDRRRNVNAPKKVEVDNINKNNMRLLICTVVMFVTFQSFSQFVIINITWINTDRALLGVLGQKLAVNTARLAAQTIIDQSFKAISTSKRNIRMYEYEENKYDGNLKPAVALNTLINGILLGIPLATGTLFSFYATPAKNEYFARELAINVLVGANMQLVRHTSIRNANTQELYALNDKMLTKLKETNKNVHKNAAFVIGASLLCRGANMSSKKLDTILSLGLWV